MRAPDGEVSALVGWDECGSTDRCGSSRSETEGRRAPTRGRFGILTRVGNEGEHCGGGHRRRTRMRRGRGCAEERHGRAAERGGRNGAEGGEVRHGVFAPVGRFCWGLSVWSAEGDNPENER